MARELVADPDDTDLVVDVAPAHPERLVDAQPGEGEQLQHLAVGLGVLEHTGEVGALQYPHRPRSPAWLLARLKASHRVVDQQAPAQREAAYLVEDDQRQLGGGGRHRLAR